MSRMAGVIAARYVLASARLASRGALAGDVGWGLLACRLLWAVASVERTDRAYAGQAIYTRGFLAVYDALVYGFNSPVLWRCSKARIIELYDANVSARHLDIGVGSGRVLDDCHFPVPEPALTLMDLNPNSLAVASRRLERYHPAIHQANALEPWGLPANSFDSIGMSHLLHCLPGAMPEKTVVFEYADAALAPGGVLFGATILGEGVKHTRLSRAVMRANNRQGVLSNLEDRLVDLNAGLERTFASHEIHVEGAVALFTARSQD